MPGAEAIVDREPDYRPDDCVSVRLDRALQVILIARAIKENESDSRAREHENGQPNGVRIAFSRRAAAHAIILATTEGGLFHFGRSSEFADAHFSV